MCASSVSSQPRGCISEAAGDRGLAKARHRVRRRDPAGSQVPGLRKTRWGDAVGGRGSSPGSSRVQGSAVFRLPSDLTPGPQKPPGCVAMAQLSSRCQINEPTSGWVYTPASQAAEWKMNAGQLARLLHAYEGD